MREASLYFSDAHLGAGKRNLDLVRASFGSLPAFLRERYLMVRQAIDLGDHTENWLTAKTFERPYVDAEVIGATREMYRNLFGDRKPVVLASVGNHQADILGNDCSAGEAMESSERARDELEVFLRRVFDDVPEADVSVFRGIRQTEENVFSHHGDFLNVQQRLSEILSELTEAMTPQQKIELINGRAELYEDMQKEVWQKFKKYLWPALRNVPHFVDLTFPPYVFMAKLKALFREKIVIKSGRPVRECWKNSVFDETLMQFELLEKLTEQPENSAIVSGHFHVPNLVRNVGGLRGTVVSLGAWHDTHLKPAMAVSANHEGRNYFMLTEYDSGTNRWNVRDEQVI